MQLPDRNLSCHKLIGFLGVCLCLFQIGCSSKTAETPSDPAAPAVEEFTGEFADIDRLLASQQYEEARLLIEKRRAELPSSEHLTAWEIDLQGQILRMAHGKEVLYFALHLPITYRRAPGRKDALETVQMANTRGITTLVVCVAMKSGEIVWSRGVDGIYWMAVDPATDNLFVVDDTVFEFSAAAGEVVQQHLLNEKEDTERVSIENFGEALRRLNERRDAKNPNGLLFGNGEVFMPDRLFAKRASSAPFYDVQQRSLERIQSADWMPTSPDGTRQLYPTQTGWKCMDVATESQLWTVDAPTRPKMRPAWRETRPTLRPVWKDDKVIFYGHGSRKDHTVVFAVNVADGTTAWSTKLKWGYYQEMHLAGSLAHQQSVVPLGLLERHIIALDSSGRLYILNPDDGHVMARVKLGRIYAAVPFQYGDQLIVPTRRHVRSYALANLLHPGDSRHALLQVREARCLLGAEDVQGSLALLDHLTERAPQFAAGWAARGEACRAVDHVERGFSDWRARSISGDPLDPSSNPSDALLQSFDLDSQPTLGMTQCDDDFYIGTSAGGIWRLQPQSSTVELVKTLDRKILYTLSAQQLRSFVGLPPASKPKTIDKESIPREWNIEGGKLDISRPVTYKGRQFRSMRGGLVRVLSGSEVKDFDAKLQGVDRWKIQISDGGPLGSGSDVYQLDENLVPVAKIIQLTKTENDTPSRTRILFLQSTAETIGMVLQTSAGAALRVYSRSGKLLNEVSLDRAVAAKRDSKAFIPVGDGYLFSDQRITWASGGDDKRVWDFGPAYERTAEPSWGYRERYFGQPIVHDSRLFVTAQDGYLLTFDLDAITKAK